MIRISLQRIFLLFTCVFFFTILYIILSLVSSNDLCSCEKLSKHDEINSNLIYSNHLAVIVPFRNRVNELLSFIPHMHSFLKNQNISYEFYIINQKDKYRFNRGLLINVGFILSVNTSTYMVMHDIDLLPLNSQLSYKFPKQGPFHISGPSIHPKYHYDKFLGGILLMQNKHFIQVNGFSNNYWGWGLEDDEFYARIKEAKLKINRPVNISTNNTNSFLHLHDPTQKRDTAKLFNQRAITRKRDRKTGLDTTKYQLLGVHNLTSEGVSFRIFDVALVCNHSITPWCQPVSSSV